MGKQIEMSWSPPLLRLRIITLFMLMFTIIQENIFIYLLYTEIKIFRPSQRNRDCSNIINCFCL